MVSFQIDDFQLDDQILVRQPQIHFYMAPVRRLCTWIYISCLDHYKLYWLNAINYV